MLYTYSDIVTHLTDYLLDQTSDRTIRYAKRAASDGLRELANVHPWSYYKAVNRITTVASYSTGTVAFDYTGGANERQLTLTDGTFPLWIEDGSVIIDNVPYEVDERISNTVVTLSRSSNPGADVSSTTYSCFRDTYPLPVDFVSVDRVINLERTFEMQYVTPKDWLSAQRYFRTPGTVWYYSILGDQNYQGTMAMKLAGAPSTAEVIDIMYRRRPRTLRYYEYKTGTVSCDAEGTAITGSGTTFSAFMVGSVIRLYDSSNYPTNEEGAYPAYVERTITDVSSTTVLTVDAAIPDAYSGVKFVITDPIDVDKQVMLGAYKATCERMVEKYRMGKNLPLVTEMWMQELKIAMGADKRYTGTGIAGGGSFGGEGKITDDAIVA